MSLKEHSYSDGIYDSSVALLGPVPPPLGGVAVHVQRVAHKFETQRNRVHIFNTLSPMRIRWGRFFFIFYFVHLFCFLFLFRPKRVYHHTLYLNATMVEFRLLLFFKRIFGFSLTLIEHSCRALSGRNKKFKDSLGACNAFVDEHVFIGLSTYESFLTAGVRAAKNCSIEAAFLPPDKAQESQIVALYPAALFAFLNRHTLVFLANASQMSYHAGQELYGFDLCLAAIEELVKTYPHIGLVLVLANRGDSVLFEKLCKSIEKKENIYLLYQCSAELWPLLKQVDLFVRPTLSDGASVSLQEAVILGTPAIASDVCERPAGTILFRAGELKDFVCKTDEVFKKNEAINLRRDNPHAQQTV